MKGFFKNLLISFLIAVMTLGPSSLAYDDVPGSSPYFYAIEYLRRNDVVRTKKLFKPQTLISKAEFIQYLVKLNNPDFNAKKTVRLPYEDTRDAAWYASYVHEAIQLGILSGNEKKLNPYSKLNKIEALKLLFNSQSIPVPRKHVGKIPYKDVQRNKQSQGLIMRALELDLIEQKSNDRVGIYDKVTRAEAALMIYRLDLVNIRPSSTFKNNASSDDVRLQKFINAWELVTGNYVDKDGLDKKILSDSAIRALVESLDDPYSVYLDEEENSFFGDELDGQIEGIGAFIAVNEEDEVTIVSPIHNSPAYHAGVKAGDVVIGVDDFDAKGQSLQDVVNRIKGPKGTKVKLMLRRGGRTVTIEVVRDVIQIESLSYEVIGKGDIMYIKLLNFNQNAIEDLREVSEIIENNSKIKGVILDLRNNPGGLLDVAVGLLGFFLPQGSQAVHIEYNFFNYTQNTTGSPSLEDYPMMVLINKGSASASEIVAGALQDNDQAMVIGEQSFGKGTVQELNYFGDSSSLKITVAKWLTPDRHEIQGNGITPDVKVVDEEVGGVDRILEKAITELNKQIR